jgi:uncharacterized OB-fold protein
MTAPEQAPDQTAGTGAAGGLLRGLAHLHADAHTQPFWDAAAQHRLVCQQCSNCQAFRMPPAAFCWRCRHPESHWVDLPGTGTVYSYTSVGYSTAPEIAAEDLPYVVCVVELDGCDGFRLVANLLGVAPGDARVGQAVRVSWDDAAEGISVPRFLPDDEPRAAR